MGQYCWNDYVPVYSRAQLCVLGGLSQGLACVAQQSLVCAQEPDRTAAQWAL